MHSRETEATLWRFRLVSLLIGGQLVRYPFEIHHHWAEFHPRNAFDSLSMKREPLSKKFLREEQFTIGQLSDINCKSGIDGATRSKGRIEVDSAVRTVMGLTLDCARLHDI
jgi:hypothetical protein